MIGAPRRSAAVPGRGKGGGNGTGRRFTSIATNSRDASLLHPFCGAAQAARRREDGQTPMLQEILMGIEIVVNIAMLLGAIFCFWNVGQDIPPPPVKGAMSADIWPRMLLAGLIIALVFNIRAIYKANTAPGAKKEIAFKEFFSFKFIAAAIVLIVYSITIEYTGFLVTTFLFFMVFAFLIGLRKPVQLIVGSVVATVLMYVIFQLGLQVMLPRGTGIFREANIWLEVLFT